MSARKLKPQQGRTKCYKPAKGKVWNPLLKYPPNAKCFCGKRVKAKKCCLRIIKPAIPFEEANKLQAYVDLAVKNHAK